MNDYLDSEAEDDGPAAPFWMTTYSDMVTLLLVFFVLIVAMSEVKVVKFKDALSHFQGRSGLFSYSAYSVPTRDQVIAAFHSEERIKRYKDLIAQLEEHGFQDKVQVNVTEKGFHIVITNSAMFATGEAKLVEPSRKALELISDRLDGMVASVIVEGHTDDLPINTNLYPSNWELSTARAASVVRFLLEQEDALDPSQYVAVGYGEHRPLDRRGTPEGRARNRRVEMLFSWESWPSSNDSLLTPPSGR